MRSSPLLAGASCICAPLAPWRRNPSPRSSGLPLTWLLLRRLAEGDTTALALALVVAASALLGFTKAENERIWLFLVPLACIAAASGERVRHLRWLLGGLVVQALAVELLLDTTW